MYPAQLVFSVLLIALQIIIIITAAAVLSWASHLRAVLALRSSNIIACIDRLVREEDPRHALVFPPLAEGVLVVEQAQLLDDVLHDQVCVDCRLASDDFLVCFAKLTNLANVESLIWIKLQHARDKATKLS